MFHFTFEPLHTLQLRTLKLMKKWTIKFSDSKQQNTDKRLLHGSIGERTSMPTALIKTANSMMAAIEGVSCL